MSGVISQFPCRAKNQPTAILKRQSKDSKPFKDKAVVKFWLFASKFGCFYDDSITHLIPAASWHKTSSKCILIVTGSSGGGGQRKNEKPCHLCMTIRIIKPLTGSCKIITHSASDKQKLDSHPQCHWCRFRWREIWFWDLPIDDKTLKHFISIGVISAISQLEWLTLS